MFTHTKRVTVVCIALALLGVLLIGGRVPMAADDYCHAAGAAQHGVFGELSARYAGWSGRFAQGALTSLSFTLFGNHAVAFSTALLLVGLIAALAFALHPHTHDPLITGALLGVLFIGALAGFAWQSFFWMAGGQTYIPPLICAALLWGLVERRVGGLIIPSIAFLASGFHEVSALLIGALLIVGLWRHARVHVIDALIGLSAGAVVVLLAPGNGVREALLPEPLSVSVALVNALAGAIANLLRVLINAPLVVAALVVLGAAVFGGEAFRPRVLLAAIAVGIGFSLFTLLPSAYLMGNISPPRYYALATAALCAAFVMVGAGLPRIQWRYAMVGLALAGLVSVALLGLTSVTALSEADGFERLASLDTSDSAAWVQECKTEWEITIAQ